MKKIYFFKLLFFCYILTQSTVTIQGKELPLDEHTIINYCKKNKDTFIAIIWPITQGKTKKIESLFSHYGKICFKKEILLTEEIAYHILKESHYNCPAARDMESHFAWYFPKGALDNPAKIYVIKSSSLSKILKCKYAIRKLFNLQYRAIHINDTHKETIALAKVLFTTHLYQKVLRI